MTPADLSLTVLRAVRRAVGDGVLAVREVPPRVVVERPRAGGCGDWATNAALQLAGPAALPPRQVAEVLRERLLDAPGIERVDITGPGFLNLTLRPGTRAEAGRLLVRRVREEGRRYGYGDALGRLPEHEVRFLVPDGADLRLRALTRAVVALLRSQGAPARATGGQASGGQATSAQATSDQAPAGQVTGAQVTGARATGDQATGGRAARRLRAVPPHYDVAAALGPDARQWALLRPAAHDRVLDAAPLLRLTEADNPLFTVQYAHARSRALLRNAADLGFTGAYEEEVDAPELLAALADHPAVLLAAARRHAPDRLARHLEATADAFLGFQHTVLPRGDEKPSAAHRSRLALAEAAGTVLAGGLSLLGVSAPDHL
ncbi:DALR anticodon-binding domain-containing protein [Streptomyces sp. TRM76323]|uniref:arginine--tRNA ligase n=1 Tax=Streptomyces tamarix TaxID=3078565 RepID=A0ABU3QCY8_9ACTN|nr:DALR anticodon-binding domain-containing protein [Streptomyces tamarix]MDT9680640.1 DALR anticodon-binding domain-containing protein [Streptomyces tamarix]